MLARARIIHPGPLPGFGVPDTSGFRFWAFGGELGVLTSISGIPPLQLLSRFVLISLRNLDSSFLIQISLPWSNFSDTLFLFSHSSSSLYVVLNTKIKFQFKLHFQNVVCRLMCCQYYLRYQFFISPVILKAQENHILEMSGTGVFCDKLENFTSKIRFTKKCRKIFQRLITNCKSSYYCHFSWDTLYFRSGVDNV